MLIGSSSLVQSTRLSALLKTQALDQIFFEPAQLRTQPADLGV